MFFKTRLFNLPLSKDVLRAQRPVTNVLDFVDVLGQFFKHNIIGERFNADPVLNFQVDKQVDTDLREAIGNALKLGALVYSERTDGEFLRYGIATAKIRISYLLASEYMLPLMKGKSRTASFILDTEKVRAQLDPAEMMLPLFPDENTRNVPD